MKRILIRILAALIGLKIGILSVSLPIKRPNTISRSALPTIGCAPHYDENVLATKLRENDDPQLFSAFRELPLYAMPDCVDEAYSLTWIPSFHPPVLVRVWRSGDRAFMVAKRLDGRGYRFGKVDEATSRPLTRFEWRDFTDLMNRKSYWELSPTVDEMLPQDGAVWLIDGLRSKEFHWVRRQVPNKDYADICKHLIRLSGLETAHDLYLP